MGVAKRKTKFGLTVEYHYSFSQGGKRYRGVCEGCTTKREAEEYEKKLRDTAKEAASQKNVRLLVERFRDTLTGGNTISLNDAYELSLDKPKKRMPSDRLINAKRSYWLDFVSFMNEKFPDVKNLADVRTGHAEAYIQYLRKNGRFNKTVSYPGTTIAKKREYQLRGTLSAKTVNTYQQVLAEVFQLLARDAGIVDNPFLGIPKLEREAESREAFTEQELIAIRDNADDFTRPLFMIAVATALREGDICTLKWKEVNFTTSVIVKQMRKTGNVVEIPMMPPLKAYLQELKNHCKETDKYAEYVLPEHARMYLTNSSGISYRIKQFLENKCGITTTKIPGNRSRAVSVKDLHSCRHTFCYYAGLYGIPLTIVQSIVGHMTQEMTKHYSAHASIEAKREKMKQLPAFLTLAAPAETETPSNTEERDSITRALESATPQQLDEIKRILGIE